MSDCLLCRLVSGEAERTLVYEDDRCVGVLDLYPVTPGHTLLIPRSHAALLADLDVLDGEQLFAVGQRIAAGLYGCGLRCEGINFFLADGEAAGQEVGHVHFHVIPRYQGDPFRIDRIGGWQEAARSELERIGVKIREAL